jgi:transposase-like protein
MTDAELCPRCGYAETALVRKELEGEGGYKKSWRCPRCSNTWETKE